MMTNLRSTWTLRSTPTNGSGNAKNMELRVQLRTNWGPAGKRCAGTTHNTSNGSPHGNIPISTYQLQATEPLPAPGL